MGGISEIIQSPTFARQKQKLKKSRINTLDEAVKTIMATPDIGDLKKGDLQGIRVYKYKVGTDLVLLAYEIDGSTLHLYAFGSHQNFYRELGKYLHH